MHGQNHFKVLFFFNLTVRVWISYKNCVCLEELHTRIYARYSFTAMFAVMRHKNLKIINYFKTKINQNYL